MNEIPDVPDWNGCENDPDCSLIYERFFGKSNEEIQGLLKENFVMRCIDWGVMPRKPFEYYFRGFEMYLDSRKGDSEELGFSIARTLDAVDSQFEGKPNLRADFWRAHADSIQSLEHFAIQLTDEVRSEIQLRIGDIKTSLINN